METTQPNVAISTLHSLIKLRGTSSNYKHHLYTRGIKFQDKLLEHFSLQGYQLLKTSLQHVGSLQSKVEHAAERVTTLGSECSGGDMSTFSFDFSVWETGARHISPAPHCQYMQISRLCRSLKVIRNLRRETIEPSR